MSRRMVSMAVCIGGMPFSAWAQEVEPLPDGWSVVSVEHPIESMDCNSEQVVMRSRDGTVQRLIGTDLETLPSLPSDLGRGAGYGRHIAVDSKGQIYLVGRQLIAQWDGEDWRALKGKDWSGEVWDITVLDTDRVVLLGSARLGLIDGNRIRSFASPTWHDLSAISGTNIVDLWVVGLGGLVFHHTEEGWQSIEPPSDRMLSGVLPCGPGCVWAWDGSGVQRWGGSHDEIWQWQAGEWHDRSLEEPPRRPQLAMDGEKIWMVGSETVHQWDGETWTLVFTDQVFDPATYPNFVDVCLTDSMVVVAEGSQKGKLIIGPR